MGSAGHQDFESMLLDVAEPSPSNDVKEQTRMSLPECPTTVMDVSESSSSAPMPSRDDSEAFLSIVQPSYERAIDQGSRSRNMSHNIRDGDMGDPNEKQINHGVSSTHPAPPKRARTYPEELPAGKLFLSTAESLSFGNCSSRLSSPEQGGTNPDDVDESQPASWQVVDNPPTDEDLMSFSAESFDFDSSDDDSDRGEVSGKQANTLTKPFDMAVLKTSIEQGSKALEILTGKDVVLVVGKTGTGKSTLIQGIAGKTLKHAVYNTRYNGQSLGRQVFETSEEPIAGFEIGHAKTSKTKAINCFKRQLDNGSEMFYLDTPGYEDTDEPEIDIATSVMLSHVAKKCKSLRFCILINYASLLEDRGGSMCAVLKFTRAFVKDFKAEKKSFMFLFTHTDEILGIPDALVDARKYLIKEIIYIIDGTNDQDVLTVLEFMRKSLQRGFPFADILHPLRTNFNELSELIERKLAPIKNPRLAAHCGLTVSSRLNLVAEVETMMLRLKCLLSESPVDTSQVQDIRATFRYLGSLIEFGAIRAKARESEVLIEGYCTAQEVAIDEVLRRGTTLEEAFGPENVKTLTIAMQKLSELKESSANHFSNKVMREIASFQEGMLSECPVKFDSVSLKLDKLRTWAGILHECVVHYEEARDHFVAEIYNISVTVSGQDISHLQGASRDELSSLVAHLGALELISIHAGELSGHNLNVDAALDTLFLAKKNITLFLSSWKDVKASMMHADSLEIYTLKTLASQAKCLHLLQGVLDEASVCEDIAGTARSVSTFIEAKVVGIFQDAAREFSNAQLPPEEQSIKDLGLMKHASEYFHGMQGGRWREVGFACSAALGNVRSMLLQRSRELEATINFVQEHGITDGRASGELLVAFDACIGFDEFFDPKDRFVENCSINYHHIYNDRASRVMNEVTSFFSAFCDPRAGPSVDTMHALRRLKPLVKEANQIAEFACTTGDDGLSVVVSDANLRLREYVVTISKRTVKSIKQWNAVVNAKKPQKMRGADTLPNRIVDSINSANLKKIGTVTKRLDNLLEEIELLGTLDLPDDVHQRLSGLLSDITESLRGYSIENELQGEQKYTLLANRLKCLEAMENFSNVAKYLPSFESVKHKAASVVSQDAEKIETMVGDTSQWDDIDTLLQDFEKATVLDPYIGDQATSRLRPLQKLRQRKEADVDSHLDEFVAKQDFKGIGKFLSPLAESKDQLKRQKFDHYRRMICTSLVKRMDIIDRNLDTRISAVTAREIADGITALVDAEKEIGRHLRAEIDLAPKIKKIRKDLDGKLSRMLDNVFNGVKEYDFLKMEVFRRRAIMYSKATEKYLTTEILRRRNEALQRCKQALDSVPNLMDRFFETKFAGESDFVRVLTGLKRASETSRPEVVAITGLYGRSRKDLGERLDELLKNIDRYMSETQCFDDGISVLHALARQLDAGLKDHVDGPHLVFECQSRLERWRDAQKEYGRYLEFGGKDSKDKLKLWSEKLNKLQSRPLWGSASIRAWFSGGTYDRICRQLSDEVSSRFSQGKSALQNLDFVQLQDCIELLDLIHQHVGKHINIAARRSQALKELAQKSFLSLAATATDVLEAKELSLFESLFADIRGFVLLIPCTLDTPSSKKAHSLVNQLVFEIVSSQIASVARLAKMESDSFDFSAIKLEVNHARAFGGFVADHFTLLREELRICGHMEADSWLVKLSDLCHEQFGFGRDLLRIKHYAVLGVAPSATKAEIESAYRAKALIYHPDKRRPCQGVDINAEFRRINEARDELLESKSTTKSSESQPFDHLIKRIGEVLRKKVRNFLSEQRYELIGHVLTRLSDLSELDDLVVPALNSKIIEEAIRELIRNHVNKVKVEVGSNWSARKYRDLNDNIVDLKAMERHFNSHRDIFSTSWNTGIVETIENEIKKLGREARGFLSSKANAMENKEDFRRCFLQMGYVLVELPLFKEQTKKNMSDVLEACLHAEWGYSYLFKIGLSLQRGDEDWDEDETRVAQMILSEFSHFNEVMTMTWNSETTQKPVEDTVLGIKGLGLVDSKPIDIERQALLKSFEVFERQYKHLLGEYIRPEADLNVLVQKTDSLCAQFRPVRCNDGWGVSLKRDIPNILAGVFAIFTIYKSGKSFNRIESSEEASELGEQLLLKPHNIQVLTVLYMLGCGCPISNTLASQLMQIRTGEGKSMILGAVASVLGLLGFRVRCVCYSEYLSNRDHALFDEVFAAFGLYDCIKYSKITTLSEDATAAKGDIRGLTISLLRQNLGTAGGGGDENKMIANRTTASAQCFFSELPGTRRRQHNLSIDDDSQVRSPSSYKRSRDDLTQQDQTVQMDSESSGLARSSSSRDLNRPRAKEAIKNTDSNTAETREMEISSSGSSRTEPALQMNTDSNGRVKSGSPGRSSYPRAKGDINSTHSNSTKIGKVEIDSPVSNLDEVKMNLESDAIEPTEEILCVDEVDVFFGPSFYGQTYNQVSQLREPEVAEILRVIWESFKRGGRKQRIGDIKSLPAYRRLLQKMPDFDYLLDKEISLMLDQVQRVDEEPYFLDSNDRIGYKVMDTISFEATYGYRTVFAYLKESDNGNLKDETGTLKKMLSIPVSCGQFSYANIQPTRIMGVSGTLEAMGDFEKGVLGKYGIEKFVFLPSVYGQSNFKFDKAGDGIYIESNQSDFFHRICSEITKVTKQKRAVIVFFRDATRLKEFESTAFYRQLGRQKSLLTEDMGADEKEFVIKKAATAGQLTISTAVFGRGTDFFCKDQRVQDNGGVHVIQTFLSTEKSEEIQIQGRTARQGKEGTYQMILLETDLKDEFGLTLAGKSRAEWYKSLSDARDSCHRLSCKKIEANLVEATARDRNTHQYFDALLARNESAAKKMFEEIYLSMKKKHMPSTIDIDLGFIVDVTGSMGPYSRAVLATMTTLTTGPTSIVSKLKLKFPEIEFKLRVATLAFRDIEDKDIQFHESGWGNSHFTESMSDAIKFMESATTNPSGGFDLAEDHIGALHRCVSWAGPEDWTSAIKIAMLLTDAPAHGLVPLGSAGVTNADNFSVRHPEGLTAETVIDDLMSKDIDLFFCSFNPSATATTESHLSKLYRDHVKNTDEHEITVIPMVSRQQCPPGTSELAGGNGQHIIFVLDESGSMRHHWAGVVCAYQNYVKRRLQNQSQSDLVSVVQFSDGARVTVQKETITKTPHDLNFKSGGTCFHPAAQSACMVARDSPGSHAPVVVFMSDGGSGDAARAASVFSSLNGEIRNHTERDLELHVIAFGTGANMQQLQLIANASPMGKVYSSADTAQLSNIFVDIASSQDVGSLLEAEIGRRIADAVTDKISLEYIG